MADPTLVTRDMSGTNSALLELIPETSISIVSLIMYSQYICTIRIIIPKWRDYDNEITTMTNTCFHQPRQEQLWIPH